MSAQRTPGQIPHVAAGKASARNGSTRRIRYRTSTPRRRTGRRHQSTHHPPRPGGMVPGDTGKVEGRDRAQPQLGKRANADAANAHADRAQTARGHPARPAVPDRRPAIGTVRLRRRRQQQRRGNGGLPMGLANGERFRIAYCCHEGDFPVPDGWTFITSSFGGVKDAERRASGRTW